jgi:hypothetical protein
MSFCAIYGFEWLHSERSSWQIWNAYRYRHIVTIEERNYIGKMHLHQPIRLVLFLKGVPYVIRQLSSGAKFDTQRIVLIPTQKSRRKYEQAITDSLLLGHQPWRSSQVLEVKNAASNSVGNTVRPLGRIFIKRSFISAPLRDECGFVWRNVSYTTMKVRA